MNQYFRKTKAKVAIKTTTMKIVHGSALIDKTNAMENNCLNVFSNLDNILNMYIAIIMSKNIKMSADKAMILDQSVLI